MGLKITNTTATSEGNTTALYLHITEFYQNKEGKVQLPVKYYKTKGGVEVNVFSPFEKLFNYQLENIEGGAQELTEGLTKGQCYEKIKATLTAAGKTVVDEI
jgi:hypothetical protein